MNGKLEVFDFVQKCKVYFLATYDKHADQVRVRPFGTFHMFENKIYIQTGKQKEVSKQIAVNPKVEICALHEGTEWIRIEATLVEDKRMEAQQSMLDSFPFLKDCYKAGDDNCQVFYLSDAMATIYSCTHPPKYISFSH